MFHDGSERGVQLPKIRRQVSSSLKVPDMVKPENGVEKRGAPRRKPRETGTVGNGRIGIEPAAFVLPRRRSAPAKSKSSYGVELRANNLHVIDGFTTEQERVAVRVMRGGSHQVTRDALRPLDATIMS